MERSFRTILSEFLKEEGAHSSESAPLSGSANTRVHPEVFFTWRPSPASFGGAPKRHGYVSARRQTATPALERPEMLVALNDLGAADRDHATVLIRMGATELEAGLSLKRVKAAHRRLAKRLHPDILPADCPREAREAAASQFRQLHSAYNALRVRLERC